MHYVIIGAGIAGISAAKAIRDRDSNADITMISDEETKPYYRPMIPLLIEGQEIDVSYTEDLEADYDIKLLFDTVTAVDKDSKAVVLGSGGRLEFDRLLIATGSNPIIPDIQGIKGRNVYTLRTRRDALKIKEALPDSKEAIVIGAGFVGIKAALALRKAGKDVTVIEELHQVLPKRLDRRAAEIVSSLLKAEGIDILTGETVTEVIREGERVKGVRLGSGTVLNADMLVVAVGVKPNIDIFLNSGIKASMGIIVDETLQTNIPDIYAAGDVVEYRDLLTGRTSVSGLWSNAEEMGRIAGANMAGERLRYAGFLTVMNATDIAGVPLITVGIADPEEDGYEVFVEDKGSGYRKLLFKGEVPVGAIFIGDIERAGIYTSIIKGRLPIKEIKEDAIAGRLEYIRFARIGELIASGPSF